MSQPRAVLSDISSWYGNSPAALLSAVGIWIAVILAVIVAQRVLIRWLAHRASATSTEIDNFFVAMLRKTRFAFIVFAAMTAASATLNLPPRLRFAVALVGKLALLVQIAIWGGELIVVVFRRYFGRVRDGASSTTVEALSYAARLILWVLIILAGLESFGIKVTALVAGLGIGGIAVALAVQNILGDVFAALSILFDKPFVVGDLIEIGSSFSGTVTHIGIKSTRLRSVTGELVILANGEVLKSGVRNFERLGQRRAVLITRIAPDTSEAKARAVPGIVKKIVESRPGATFSRTHFKTITDNSFEFETVYFLSTTDYDAFLDCQQEINLALVRELRAAGINLLSQKSSPPALRAPEKETAPPAQAGA